MRTTLFIRCFIDFRKFSPLFLIAFLKEYDFVSRGKCSILIQVLYDKEVDEYLLFLDNDINSRGHTQWFYFVQSLDVWSINVNVLYINENDMKMKVLRLTVAGLDMFMPRPYATAELDECIEYELSTCLTPQSDDLFGFGSFGSFGSS